MKESGEFYPVIKLWSFRLKSLVNYNSVQFQSSESCDLLHSIFENLYRLL